MVGNCLLCGNPHLRSCTIRLERTLGGRRLAGSVPATKCDACGEEFITAADLGRFELAIATRLARTGPHCGQALRFMRKALALSVADLAELLHLPTQTIDAWEASPHEVEDPTVSSFAAMVIYRGAMRGERLRALGRRAGDPSGARPTMT